MGTVNCWGSSPMAIQFEREREQAAQNKLMLERALGILHRFAQEQTGWQRMYRRWWYSDEPLRNDAANLVREAGFTQEMASDAKLVGTDPFDTNFSRS